MIQRKWRRTSWSVMDTSARRTWGVRTYRLKAAVQAASFAESQSPPQHLLTPFRKYRGHPCKVLFGEAPTVLTNPKRAFAREGRDANSQPMSGCPEHSEVEEEQPQTAWRRPTPGPAIRSPLCRGPTTLPSTRSLVTGTKHTPLTLGFTPPMRGTSVDDEVLLSKYPRPVALDSPGRHPPTPPSSRPQISTSHMGTT